MNITEKTLTKLYEGFKPVVDKEINKYEEGDKFCLEGDNCVVVFSSHGGKIYFTVLRSPQVHVNAEYSEGIEDQILDQLGAPEEGQESEDIVIYGKNFYMVAWADMYGDIFYNSYETMPEHVNYCVEEFLDA